jgi:hypothetical protein
MVLGGPKAKPVEQEINCISQEQAENLRAALKDEKDLTPMILKYYNIISFKELKSAEYEKVMSRIIEHKNKNLSIHNPNK